MTDFRAAIVGIRWRPDECKEAAARMKPGDSVRLEREPDNPYDAYAIRVFFLGLHVGYLPKGPNKPIADLMDVGHSVSAFVEKAPEVRGSWVKVEPIIQIRVGEMQPPAAA